MLKIGMEQLTGANGDLNRMLLHLANLQTLGQKNCLNSRVLKMYREIHGIVDSSSLSSCIAYPSGILYVCLLEYISLFFPSKDEVQLSFCCWQFDLCQDYVELVPLCLV